MTSELHAWRETDRDAWNAFVDRAPYHAFPQLWEWGELRAMGGWKPIRLLIGPSRGEPLAGAQLLLREVPLIGWRLAYVPRGPIGQLDDPRVRDGLVAALRGLGRAERIATVRTDPETTAAEPYGAALLAAPWREAAKVQPPISRILDLRPSLGELRAGMRRKHRQYVNKAQRGGVTIERFDAASDPAAVKAALDDFNQIYNLTADRAGFVARMPYYYERVWSIFAPAGRCRLSFATLDGQRVATIFHFTCGDRVVEAYGGMTDIGADSRANYLLKWSAIEGFKAEGFAVYDFWGVATGGIAQFKEGFGGREVEYVGARDLSLRGPVDVLLRLAIPAYGRAQRLRLRVLGREAPPSSEPSDA
jgi:lipid II:glycine glycyltransferase (peptidoglycan interpeptide bridge formation enzyme)